MPAQQCSHGQITPHPSNDPRHPGYATCNVCGASLRTQAERDAEIAGLRADFERLKAAAMSVSAYERETYIEPVLDALSATPIIFAGESPTGEHESPLV